MLSARLSIATLAKGAFVRAMRLSRGNYGPKVALQFNVRLLWPALQRIQSRGRAVISSEQSREGRAGRNEKLGTRPARGQRKS